MQCNNIAISNLNFVLSLKEHPEGGGEMP